MKQRTTQINVRFTPEELAEIDRVLQHPTGTGLDARSRSSVVRAALELYLGAYRATGAPPHIADAVSAIAHDDPPRRPVKYDRPIPPSKRRTA